MPPPGGMGGAFVSGLSATIASVVYRPRFLGHSIEPYAALAMD
jgi:hypothetical protein